MAGAAPIALILCLIFVLLSGAGGSEATNKKNGYGDLEGNCLIICQFLRGKEVPDMTIAAICGNIWGESRYSPRSVNTTSGASGLCNWYSTRCSSMKALAESQGKNWQDINLQLDYLWIEMTGGYKGTIDRMKKTSSIDEQVKIFCDEFENPGDFWVNNGQGRIDEAKRVYAELQKGGSEGEGFADAVSRAKSCLGKPYVWSAVGPDGYDCSGLVSYCLSGIHGRIGTTKTFWGWQQVSRSELQPGDVIVYDRCDRGGSGGHCGLYIGNGRVIHAAWAGVEETDLTTFEWGSLLGENPAPTWRYVRYQR